MGVRSTDTEDLGDRETWESKYTSWYKRRNHRMKHIVFGLSQAARLDFTSLRCAPASAFAARGRGTLYIKLYRKSLLLSTEIGDGSRGMVSFGSHSGTKNGEDVAGKLSFYLIRLAEFQIEN